MQEDNLLKNNQVKVHGRIVSELTFSHDVYGESFYNFNLEITRLSDTSDVLPITISERLIDKEELQIGVVVFITGQIRSYNNYTDTESKNRLILTIFTRDIEILPEENTNINPNEVTLNGFICKPPIYRTTPFGREIADILIAVNRAYNKSDYIPSIAWGRNARFAAKLNVGDNIRLWGRMQSRVYQKKLENGEVIERVAFEISVSKIESVEKSLKETE
ncbi:MAG: single-stranded DNA-binding protein [Clostridiales bacterium]|jgi:single-stranded DNA-binding protein|nr:single-stranded DNA-binding protein [Clostridiales bacterium]